MLRKSKYLWLGLCLLSFVAWAAESPLLMLQNTSRQLLAQLESNRPLTDAKINRIVHIVILPHVDLPGMSQTVLGRNAWGNATPAQRQEFMREFTTLVIRTYSSALSSYHDQTIEFSPMRGGADARAQIESRIIQSNGQVVPVSYRLKLQGQTWKVYDFSVEGVSMIESFRSQFAGQLESGNLSQLLQKLKEHNAGVE